jgi:hypothetical protein
VGEAAIKDAARRQGGGLTAVLDRSLAHRQCDFRPQRRNGSVQPNKETSRQAKPILHRLTHATFLTNNRPKEVGPESAEPGRPGRHGVCPL